MRLDVFLAERERVSRSRAASLIDAGKVTVNGRVEKASFKVSENDVVEADFPPAVECDVLPEDIPLEVLWEDDGMAVINKPRGMTVHPAAGHWSGTLVNALLYRYAGRLSGVGGVLRPGIVHRLDKDTSGVIAVAKNDFYHASLARQLQTREMSRVYLAVVHGNVKDDGVICANIDRCKVDRKKMAVCGVGEGRNAVTRYRVLGRAVRGNRAYSLLECRLETGRTHQIRVHLAHAGFPLVGDLVYGSGKLPFGNVGGQVLFAREIGFAHPLTGEFLRVAAETPEYFDEILRALGFEKT